MIVETEKPPSWPSVSWRTRKASGMMKSESEGLKMWCPVVSPNWTPRAWEPEWGKKKKKDISQAES